METLNQASPFSVNNDITNTNAQNLYSDLQRDNLQSYIRGAVDIYTYLTKEEEQWLAEAIYPMPIRYDTRAANLQKNEHGLAYELNRIAYNDVLATANEFTNRGLGVIDIGGTPLRTPQNVHICNIVNNNRNESRMISAAFHKLFRHDDRFRELICDDLPINANYCVHGAENCSYKASYGYAVNVYDIPIETIPKIFEKHKLMVLDMYMFVPDCILDDHLMDDQKFYTCHTDVKGNKAYFSLNDCSNIYIHDYANWRKYAETTLIDAGEYRLTVEIIKRYKTFCKFRFIKSDNEFDHDEYIVGAPIRIHHFIKRYNKAVIPDMVHYFKNNFSINPYDRRFVIERTFVDSVLDYALSAADRNFSSEGFIQTCRSYKHTVSYQSSSNITLIYKGVETTSDTFNNITTSLFIYACIMRWRRTNTIAGAINHIKDFDPEKHSHLILNIKLLLNKIGNIIKKGIHSFFDEDPDSETRLRQLFMNDAHIQPSERELSVANFIYDLKLRYVTNHVCNNVIKVDGNNYDHKIRTIKSVKPTTSPTKKLPMKSFSYVVTPSAPTVEEAYKGTSIVEMETETYIPDTPPKNPATILTNWTNYDEQNISYIQMEHNKLTSTTSTEKMRPFPRGTLVGRADYVQASSSVVDNWYDPISEYSIFEKELEYINWYNSKAESAVPTEATLNDEEPIASQLTEIEEEKLINDALKEIEESDVRIAIDASLNINTIDEDEIDLSEPLVFCNSNYKQQFADQNEERASTVSSELIFGSQNGELLDEYLDDKLIYQQKVSCNSDIIVVDQRIRYDNGTPYILMPSACKNNVYNINGRGYKCIEVKTMKESALVGNVMVMLKKGYCTLEIYNPQTDKGDCAKLCLEYHLGIKMNENNLQYLDQHDVIDLCYRYKTNVIFHKDYKYDFAFDMGFDNAIRLNLTNEHWTVLDCECECLNLHDYKKFKHDLRPYGVNYLYINCANIHLTDGKGQAKAFAEMFPNYKRTVKNVHEGVQFTTYKENGEVYHLAIVVAHNNSKKFDARSTHETYRNIFNGLFDYAKLHNLVIAMPFIGTDLYKTPISCFLRSLDTVANRTNVQWFLNTIREADYNVNTHCTHGGYRSLCIKQNAQTIKEGVENNYVKYDKNFQETGEKMRGKYDEIMRYIDTIDEQNHPIYELSAAPGHFVAEHNKGNNKRHYYFAYYIGAGHLDVSKIKNLANDKNTTCRGAYNDITKAKFNIPNDCILLLDTPIDETNVDWINNMANRYEFITKFSYEKRNLVQRIHHDVTVFRLDNSEHGSSELYIHIHRGATSNRKLDINCVNDTGELFNKVNEYIKSQAEKAPCKCKRNLMHNAYISIPTVTSKRLNEFADKHDLPRVKDDVPAFKIKSIIGVAGSCKSMSLLKETCDKCRDRIVPFNELCENNDRTFITACRHQYTKTICAIDEALCYSVEHLAYLRTVIKGEMYAMTDDKQIRYRSYDGFTPVSDEQITFIGPKLTHSSRMPDRIAKLFGYSGHKNRALFKIINCAKQVIDYVTEHKYAVILTATQAQKDDIAKQNWAQGHKILTYNESMGRTYKEVVLMLRDIESLPNDPVIAYLYVAMSRASTELVVYGDNSDIERYYKILNSPMERALDTHGIHLGNAMKPEIPKDKSANHYYPPPPQTKDNNRVCEILDRIFLPTEHKGVQNNVTDIIGYKWDILPYKENGQMLKTTMDTIMNDRARVLGRKLTNRMYSQYHFPNDKKKELDTIIKRYAKKNMKLPPTVIDLYLKGFDQFMVYGWKEKMRKMINPELIRDGVFDYIRELQKKFNQDEYESKYLEDQEFIAKIAHMVNEGYTNQQMQTHFNKDSYISKTTLEIIRNMLSGDTNKLSDLETEFHEKYHGIVSFHMKRQVKLVQGPGFEIKDKAGQGISAWSKMMNAVMSSFTRTYDSLVKNFLKPNVLLAYGASDAKLSEQFDKYHKELNDRRYKKIMADFSEFDSSQEEQGTMASIVMMKQLGMPQRIMDKYQDMRHKWKLRSITDESYIMLSGEWKQHSGQVFTLAGNTLFNMLIMGAVYQYDHIVVAAFKGDDSIIICKGYEEVKYNTTTLLKETGYKIKLETPDIPEFIANIVTPHGWFPDVIRRTSRVLTKVYTTNTDWDEVKKSVTDCLDVIHDECERRMGCVVASRFYAQFGIKITPEEVDIMVDFLVHITKLPTIDDLELRNWSLHHWNPNETQYNN